MSILGFGLWASSGPFPLSAHYGLYKRGRDPPPTNPSRHLKKERSALPLKWLLKEGRGRSPTAVVAAATTAATPCPGHWFISTVIATPPSSSRRRRRLRPPPLPPPPDRRTAIISTSTPISGHPQLLLRRDLLPLRPAPPPSRSSPPRPSPSSPISPPPPLRQVTPLPQAPRPASSTLPTVSLSGLTPPLPRFPVQKINLPSSRSASPPRPTSLSHDLLSLRHLPSNFREAYPARGFTPVSDRLSHLPPSSSRTPSLVKILLYSPILPTLPTPIASRQRSRPISLLLSRFL